jgi:hypothetical protein
MLSSHGAFWIAARLRRALQDAMKSQSRGKVPGGLARAVDTVAPEWVCAFESEWGLTS